MKANELKDAAFADARPVVITCSSDESAASALNKMKEHGIHHLPIVDHGKLSGVVSDRDLFWSSFERTCDLSEITVKSVVKRETPVVTSHSEMGDILKTMMNENYDALPIVEEQHVVGILTDTDILKLAAKLLDPEWQAPFGSVYLANPFTQRLLGLLADVGI